MADARKVCFMVNLSLLRKSSRCRSGKGMREKRFRIHEVIVLETREQTSAKRPARLNARHIHVCAPNSGLFRGACEAGPRPCQPDPRG